MIFLIKEFNRIRDLKYSIPLFFGDKNYNCSVKNNLLKEFLEKEWYKVNFRVCNFYWEDLDLPENILKIQHTKKSMHVYLEVEINEKIIVLDSTWDSWLKNIFDISIWDWENSTKIAVKETFKYSIEESRNIMQNLWEKEIKDYLEYNREFYSEINRYLKEKRIVV